MPSSHEAEAALSTCAANVRAPGTWRWAESPRLPLLGGDSLVELWPTSCSGIRSAQRQRLVPGLGGRAVL